MENPLLSICIPTYNRSKYLRSNLLSIFSQVRHPELVEVVVSDNHSTDETEAVAREFLKYENFRYFRQEENIGPAKNFLSNVALAKGEYCWIIGDDDFILQERIESILQLIGENPDVPFFYATLLDFPMEKFEKYRQPFQTLLYEESPVTTLEVIHLDKFEELLSSKYSIIFLGEVMAGIFRKSIWDTYTIHPDKNMFASLESIYPHCVIHAHTLIGRKAIFIKTPVTLALSGSRDWYDKLDYILIVYMKKLIGVYRDNGVKGALLRECYVKYIKTTIPSVLKYLKHGNKNPQLKVSLTNYFFFLLTHPYSTFLAFAYFIKSRTRRIFGIRNS